MTFILGVLRTRQPMPYKVVPEASAPARSPLWHGWIPVPQEQLVFPFSPPTPSSGSLLHPGSLTLLMCVQHSDQVLRALSIQISGDPSVLLSLSCTITYAHSSHLSSLHVLCLPRINSGLYSPPRFFSGWSGNYPKR